MTRKRRYLIAALLAIIAGITAALLVPKPLPEISRAEFLAEVSAGHVQKVAIRDNDVIIAVSTTRGAFRTPYQPSDKGLVAQLRALGVEVVFEDSGPALI